MFMRTFPSKREDRMTGVVVTGQFKEKRFLKSAEALEKFFSKNIAIFKGCRGGAFLEKDDGHFVEITFWETEKEARDMFHPDNEMLKVFEDFIADKLTENFHVDFFDVGVATFFQDFE
jgi:hypothetical protein